MEHSKGVICFPTSYVFRSNFILLLVNYKTDIFLLSTALVHSIKYTTGVFNGEWKEIKVIGEKSSYEVSLPDLKYAYTE